MIATLMGTGTLSGRDGKSARVAYLLENEPDLASLGPSHQHGTLDFLEGDAVLTGQRGPLALELENGRWVHVTIQDQMPLDPSRARYAVLWW